MKKIWTSLVCALLAAVMLFAGCAPQKNATTETGGTGNQSETPKKGGTLTVMASQGWIQDAELELAKKFEEETGIKVDYQIIPADQYHNLLTTKLNSGECADIFMAQADKLGIVSQLQIEKNGVDLTNEPWVERMSDIVADQLSVGDVVYGQMIWDVSDSYAYIYNKAIFKELGLKVPTTFEEFKAVCQTLLDNGITPIYEYVADGWHHQLNMTDVSAQYDLYSDTLVDDLNANKVKFADIPPFVETLKQMKEIADAGYFGEYYMSNELTNMGPSLASGEYAMTCNMMGRISEVDAGEGKYTSDDFGIFPVPYLDNQVIVETPGAPAKFVYSGSKQIDMAKQYLEFLGRTENLQYMIDKVPSYNALPFEGLKSTYSPAVGEAIEKYKNGKSMVYQNAVSYYNPQWMEIGTDVAAMFMGDMEPEEVVKNIDQRRADQAIAAGDPNWKK